MSDSFVLSGLTRKRSDLAGQIEHHRETIRQLTADLAAIDASIRLFDPDADTDGIPNRRYPLRSPATRGEMTRSVLAVLGSATEPLSGQDVALGVMRLRGLDADDLRLVRVVSHRVRACLSHQKRSERIRAIVSEDKAKAWVLTP